MTARERWLEAKAVFLGAMDLPAREREDYIAAHCADAELEGEVRSLIAAAVDEAGETLGGGASSNAGRALRRGDRVGCYRLLAHVGRGGMSEVYLAERADRRDDRTVALKLLHGRWLSVESRIRFENERRILSSLEHPYIARMYDGGISDDGTPFLVIERVLGEPIDRFCEDAELSLDECVELFRKVCEAVDFAHRNLVVHRDLKPDNILVSEDRVPHLLDFGIAKVLDSTANRSITQPGLAPLTPAYASPEQILDHPITFSSDVFSLGIVLYLILTRRLPFGESWQQRLAAIGDGGAPRPPSRCLAAEDGRAAASWPRSDRRWSRQLADGLDMIVLKALRTEPEERYLTVRELADDLRRWQHGFPIKAEMTSLRIRARKFLRRHRVGAAASAAVLLLTVIGTVALVVFAQKAARERRIAETERARAEEVTSFLSELFAFQPTEPSTVPGLRLVLDSAVGEAESRFQGRPRLEAEVYSALGDGYAYLGLHEAARRLFQRSLRAGRSGGADRLEIADTQIRLAVAEQRVGSLATARKRLEVLTRALIPDEPAARHLSHRATLQLAGLLLLTGEHDDGEALIESALRAAENQWGPESDPAATARTALGIHLAEMGRNQAAERELTRAMEIRGEDMLVDTTGRQALQALATLKRRRGQVESSADILERIIDGFEARYGSDHFELAVYYRDLARCRALEGDDAAAEALFRRALEKVTDENPHAGMAYLTIKQSLARVLSRRSKLDEAERLAGEALALTEAMMGADHFSRAFIIQDLGRFALVRGHIDEAIRLLRDAIRIQEAVLPPDNQYLMTARVDLARALMLTADHLRAEELLEAVWSPLQSALRRDDHPPGLGGVPLPLDAATAFAELHAATGDAELARQWTATAESLRQRSLRPQTDENLAP